MFPVISLISKHSPATSGKPQLNESTPNNLWYRFIVTDGTDTDYYADNTPALDGGLGSPSDDIVDKSYALMFYDPAFTAPAWAEQRLHLSDLPRPLPQRSLQQRPADRRSALR